MSEITRFYLPIVDESPLMALANDLKQHVAHATEINGFPVVFDPDLPTGTMILRQRGADIAKLLMDMNERFADLPWIEGKNETP